MSSILFGGTVSFNLPSENVSISGSVHRALNDLVARATNDEIMGWKDRFNISFLNSKDVKFESVGHDSSGEDRQLLVSSFEERLTFIPSLNCEHVHVCFEREVPELLKEWWKRFAKIGARMNKLE